MKRALSILMVLCLLGMSVPTLAISKGDLLVVTNCKSWVSLRKSPSTSAERLKKLPKGAYVNYMGIYRNGFALVLHDGTYGYVLKNYLERPCQAMRIVNCREYVSLRAAPSTRAARIRKIRLGEVVVHECETASGFSQVYSNGRSGYVLSRHLQPIDKADGARRYVVNCKSYISLRSDPSTRASRLAKIPLGAAVISLGSAGGGMDYVYYNGQYGFVLSKYLSTYLLNK